MSCAFNSLFEMLKRSDLNPYVYDGTFNSLFEMLGVLEIGFSGFLSFCVGVCRFLAGTC